MTYLYLQKFHFRDRARAALVPPTFACEVGELPVLHTAWGIVHPYSTGQTSNDEHLAFCLPSVTVCSALSTSCCSACTAVFPSVVHVRAIGSDRHARHVVYRSDRCQLDVSRLATARHEQLVHLRLGLLAARNRRVLQLE